MKLRWRAVYPFLLRVAFIAGMEDADLDCSDANERSVTSLPNDVTQDSGNLPDLRSQRRMKPRKNKKCECGLSSESDEAERRIIGGQSVRLGKYPWLVTIDHFVGECTGTIVAPNKVITAAHCILSPKKSVEKLGKDQCIIPVTVRGGEAYCDMSPHTTVIFSKEALSDSSVRVKRAAFSKNYKPKHCRLDIAVLTTEKSFPCSNFTRPICLPSKDPIVSGANMTVAGWGNYLPGGKPSKDGKYILRDGFMKITKKTHKKHCFGATGSNQSVCSGDSGGPAFLREDGGPFVQIGVTSQSGSRDCDPQTEAQFQSLYHRIKWVKKHVMKS